MRKKLLSIVAVATLLFLGACSNEDVLPEPAAPSFTFSASMPADKPSTRVTLEEDGKDIILRWEEGDVMNIVVTQGTSTAVGVATLNPGSRYDDNKKAVFTPSYTSVSGVFDENQPFNFYGVYGGLGLDTTTPTNALLPENPSLSGSLEDVETKKDVMLYFAHKNVTQDDIQTGVTLHHLGSLFKITLRNNSTDILNLSTAQLQGVNEGGTWAYDFATEETVFNLETKEFENTGTGINFMAFTTNTATIAPTEEATYWSWYPVLEGNTWPELKLVLFAANPNDLTTVNSKPARSTPIVAGKNYRFYAAFDGTNLEFTDDQLGVPVVP